MINEIISKINADKSRAENDLNTRQSRARETEILLEFFTNVFEEFLKQLLSGKYSVDVKFPEVQKVEGNVSVDGITSLLQAIKELDYTTKRNKLELPQTQKIEGEVTVKNPTPETKIPEFPKQIKTDVVTLPKYIGEKLDKISRALSEIEVKPQIEVKNEAPQVSIDLSEIKNGLEAVVEEIKLIPQPEKLEIDLSKVVEACEKTTKAIQGLVFPIPNFHSSYDHSLEMRSRDMDKSFDYTTDGSKKVIESITVRDIDGGQYRKTYTYSGDGTGDPVTETKWERV